MNKIWIKTENSGVLARVAEVVGMAPKDLALDVQSLVQEHIAETEAEIPAELAGKVNVEFHFIPGKGYTIRYGLNSEPSTRVNAGAGPHFIPTRDQSPGHGGQGDSGRYISGSYERPSITDSYGMGKLDEAITGATELVRAEVSRTVPAHTVERAHREGIKIVGFERAGGVQYRLMGYLPGGKFGFVRGG